MVPTAERLTVELTCAYLCYPSNSFSATWKGDDSEHGKEKKDEMQNNQQRINQFRKCNNIEWVQSEGSIELQAWKTQQDIEIYGKGRQQCNNNPHSRENEHHLMLVLLVTMFSKHENFQMNMETVHSLEQWFDVSSLLPFSSNLISELKLLSQWERLKATGKDSKQLYKDN